MSTNLALIGCGAISRRFYLPALVNLRGSFDRIWLVDPSDHARSCAAAIVDGRQARGLSDIDEDIHLSIVATPNSLHYQLACAAMTRGSHVLVEKPFVIWPEDGVRLVQCARANQRVLAVNQTRRFFPIARRLRQQVAEGVFGPLKSIVHREGTKLVWPFESGAGFMAGSQRTGVIMDFGIHVLDFYHYILQPEWELVSATHDGFDGPEGLADLELTANGAPVSIRLSRYVDQDNVARMVFEHAEISFDVYAPAAYSVRWHSGKESAVSCGGNGSTPVAEQVILNFLAASQGQAKPVCEGADSLPLIELLDKVYGKAERYAESLGVV